MTSNLHPGTNSEATLSAAWHLDGLLVSPDGAGIRFTIGVLGPDDTNHLLPSDTLSHFSLGPC